MRLATVETGAGTGCAAALDDGRLLLLAEAARAAELSGPGAAALTAGGMQAIVEAGAAALDAIRALLARAAAGELPQAVVAADGVRFLAPIPSPAKNVFCVGRNYAEHIAEGARAQKIDIKAPEHPCFFTKPATTVCGHGADVPLFAHVSTHVDYEVELGLVIGKGGRDIAEGGALDHVFGYTIVNDVTARDVQRRHGGQFFKGKSLDGSCPMGPWLVTADAMPDPQKVAIRLWVNGELRQDGSTADMIFDIPRLIASLSEGLTLHPGDILATGTPSGVGYAMDPPRFLKDGDEVVCEIEGIGRLANTIRAV